MHLFVLYYKKGVRTLRVAFPRGLGEVPKRLSQGAGGYAARVAAFGQGAQRAIPDFASGAGGDGAAHAPAGLGRSGATPMVGHTTGCAG